MGHSNEQHHEHPSNKETLEWYKHRLQNGKVSEETYKREAVTFFNLSPEDSVKPKQIFKNSRKFRDNAQEYEKENDERLFGSK